MNDNQQLRANPLIVVMMKMYVKSVFPKSDDFICKLVIGLSNSYFQRRRKRAMCIKNMNNIQKKKLSTPRTFSLQIWIST